MEPTTAGAAHAPIISRRRFTKGSGFNPLDEVTWVTRDAWTPDSPYYNPGVLVPEFWSQNALNITSKLYLSHADPDERKSVRVLIERVAHKIYTEGQKHGYFSGTADAEIFYDELRYILVNQIAAFNSPVWFNIGRPDRPQQCSACFILSVEDSTTSITATSKREIDIFRGGSGSGFNVGRLRGSMEPLSGGGLASGPVSFMRMWDAGAGTFKSGGVTRRAAKLVCCDADHPDIRDFITCKAREEDRLRILAESGVHIGFDAEGERNVAEVTSFQNANNSVTVTDEFMRRATGEISADWPLRARAGTGGVVDIDDAKELLDLIAQAAWNCADPGLQFITTMNEWHTTPALGPIRSTNPCGEYMSNDDTSCNLASINLLKFLSDDGEGYAAENLVYVSRIMATAMDILVEFADYPDPVIAQNSRDYRQLGLGFSNLGATLMAQGLPYDSDEARDFAAAVTAVITGSVYSQSAILAEALGPFRHYEENSSVMELVLKKHREEVATSNYTSSHFSFIWDRAIDVWTHAVSYGQDHGWRNAQATVIAPAGTISFLMDCDTTGVEPPFSLVTHKQLAGGGTMKLIVNAARRAAARLGGYSEANLLAMSEGDFSMVAEEDKPTFACANEISPEGHIRMMAAIQPFISGGISKTINMPNEATWEDIREAYVLAWKLGVKDLAIYRDGSKARQVLSAKPKVVEVGEVKVSFANMEHENVQKLAKDIAFEVQRQSLDVQAKQLETMVAEPYRKRMPRTRSMRGHKIHVRSALGEHEGYVMAGVHDDGSLGEIFIEGFGKHGSFTQNALSAWATDFSIALQYGVPMEVLCRKHAYVADETGGIVVPSDEPTVLTSCKSIVDYIARWLVAEFGDVDLAEELGVMTAAVKERKAEFLGGGLLQTNIDVTLHNDSIVGSAPAGSTVMLGPPCGSCGGVTHRAGACWLCSSCGASTGCG